MRIVLVRHGEAEHPRGGDAERALTAAGVAQAQVCANWLQKRIGSANGSVRLVASPYRRAQQTAAEIGNAMRLPAATLDDITPDIDPRRALPALASLAQDVDWLVVVSHMPLVASLSMWMEEGVLGSGQSFMLAEARIFATDVPGPGTARLEDRFVPQDFSVR
jgi:phosphohistidine phosphatase